MVRMSYAQYENLIEPIDLSHPTYSTERRRGGKKSYFMTFKRIYKEYLLTHPKTHGTILLVVEMFG